MQVLLILLFGCMAGSNAQQVEASAQLTISAEKRALIKEMLDLTNASKSSEVMINAEFDQMEKQLPETEWQRLPQCKTSRNLKDGTKQLSQEVELLLKSMQKPAPPKKRSPSRRH